MEDCGISLWAEVMYRDTRTNQINRKIIMPSFVNMVTCDLTHVIHFPDRC